MRRRFEVGWPGETIPELEALRDVTGCLQVELTSTRAANRRVLVRLGEWVRRGQPLIEDEAVVTHAPLTATITGLQDARITLELPSPDGPGNTLPNERDDALVPARSHGTIDPAFLRQIGLVGMGGSMFPASHKLAACRHVHTVIINAVECEPGVTIDQALLRAEPHAIQRGAQALAAAVNADRILLAVQHDPRREADWRERYDMELVTMPATYPAGAERLIVRKLTGRDLATGELPLHAGYLVHNVASVRALGQALEGRFPVIERPLSVLSPGEGIYRNLVVPVGLPVRTLLRHVGVSYDPKEHIVVAGGLMMGNEVGLDQGIMKGTTSIIVLNQRDVPRRPETPCIRCGACNTACPLGLHPIGMVERLRGGAPVPASLLEQLESCFLCAMCSAVCPCHILLAKYLFEGKQWVRQQHQ